MIYKVHKQADIQQIIKLNIDLTTVENLFVLVEDGHSRVKKSLALNPHPNFNSDDISLIDNYSVEVRIMRSETPDWDFGAYYYAVFVSESDNDFNDAVRINSNSELGFRLVRDIERTTDPVEIEILLITGSGIPEAPVDGVLYGREDALWRPINDEFYNRTEIDDLLLTKEDDLGNPAYNGYVLSSDTSGNRSWIPMTGGGGGIPEAPLDGETWGRISASWGRVVALDGDYMTGDLGITTAGSQGVNFIGGGGHVNGSVYHSDATGQVVLARYDEAGAVMTQLILGSDGVSISGAGGGAPVIEDAQDLTTMEYVDTGLSTKENYLGLPSVSGYVLSSDTAGNRSWIQMSGGGSGTFLGLSDTPSDYTGSGGLIVAVNAAEDALEFITAPQNNTVTIVRPAPFAGTAGQTDFVITPAEEGEIFEVLMVTVGGSIQSRLDYSVTDTNVSRDTISLTNPLDEDADVIIEYFKDISNITFSDFLDLTDTPTTYTGMAGMAVAVNATEDGIEFVPSVVGNIEWGNITGTLSNQADLQAELDAKENGLGSPTTDGYVLSSDIAGVRSWIPQPVVPATTDDLAEGITNYYYTEARVSANVDVAANTADRHSHANMSLLDSIIDTGTGDNYLSDDGTYKAISVVTNFLALTDTPSDYTGMEGRSVHVNEDGTGLEFVTDAEIGSVQYVYRFDTSNTTTPADGRISTNNVDPTLITELYVNDTDRNDISADGALLALDTGDILVLQDSNSDVFYSFRVTDKGTENGDVWTIPVTYSNSNGTFNNENMKVGFIYVGAKYFTSLKDTPDDYIGQAGNTVVVNSAENALEYAVRIGQDLTGTASAVDNIWAGTQAEYDALGTYDDSILYFIQ